MLSEFRSRLVEGGAEALLLDTLLTLCREQKLLVSHGRQRMDSTNILGAVRSLNRLGCAIKTMRAALDALAVAAPNWLRELPAVGLLRRVWIQNFCLMLAEAASGKDGIIPAALCSDSNVSRCGLAGCGSVCLHDGGGGHDGWDHADGAHGG